MAYTAAAVGLAVYAVGLIASFWLPERRRAKWPTERAGPATPTSAVPKSIRCQREVSVSLALASKPSLPERQLLAAQPDVDA